jgi:invasion protein IalB
MKRIGKLLTGLATGAATLIWCHAALGAATPPVAATVLPKPISAAPAAGPAPGQSYGDWGTRCFPVSSGAPCDMFQMLVDNRTKQRVMSVSIAYAPQRGQYLIQIAVPLEVALRKGVEIQTPIYRSARLDYRRCTDACLVETAIDEASLAAIGRATGIGGIIVADRTGRQISLRLSLNGFSAALAAMRALNEMRVH